MNHLKLSIVVANFIILTGAPVLAHSGSAENENWTGPYFGLSFGAGQGNANISYQDNTFSLDSNENIFGISSSTETSQELAQTRGNLNGSIANLLIGYNVHSIRYPNLVLGGQLEGTFFTDMSLTTQGRGAITGQNILYDGASTTTSLSEGTEFEVFDVDLTSIFTFVGRAGYLIKPQLLTYILGGGIESNFSNHANISTQWVLGYTVGGGLEYRVNDHWSFRGEYRFLKVDNIRQNIYDISDDNVNPEGDNNTSRFYFTDTSHYNTNFNFNMGAISVIYRPNLF